MNLNNELDLNKVKTGRHSNYVKSHFFDSYRANTHQTDCSTG